MLYYYEVEDRVYRSDDSAPLTMDLWNGSDWEPYQGDAAAVLFNGFRTADAPDGVAAESDPTEDSRSRRLRIRAAILRRLGLVMGGPSSRYARYNENHDPSNGQFASGDGGGTATADAPSGGHAMVYVDGDEHASKDNIGVDPHEYAATIDKMITDRVGAISGESEFHINTNKHGTHVEFAIVSKDGTANLVQCERLFDPQSGSVMHQSLFLDPSFQGKGFAKDFLAYSVEHEIAAGYKRMQVSAGGDVGGYAWAKFGFVPNRGQWLDGLNAQMGMPDSKDPKDLWKVADSPKGKDLLLGAKWDGTLNFGDADAMARFHKYVGGKRSATLRADQHGDRMNEGEALYYDCFGDDGE